MKSIGSNSEKSPIYYAENVNYGIINYDSDNLYPQRVKNLANSSPRTDECNKVRERFLYGNGFYNVNLSMLIVNRDGQTMDDILTLACKDISLYKNAYIHCLYNSDLLVDEIFYMPFEGVRKGGLKKEGKYGKLCYYNNWEGILGSIKPSDFLWLNPFNPDKKILTQQIESQERENEKRKVDLIWSFNGQVLSFGMLNPLEYDLAIFESAYEDAITDAALKRFRYKNVKNDFNASLLMFFNKFKDDDIRLDTIRNLKSFQGEENANSLMAFELEENSEKPHIEKVEKNNFDGYYKETYLQSRENIRGTFEIHSALLESTSGKLGEEESKAAEIYNEKLKKERTNIQIKIFSIFKHSIWAKEFKSFDDFNIEKFEFNFSDQETASDNSQRQQPATTQIFNKKLSMAHRLLHYFK